MLRATCCALSRDGMAQAAPSGGARGTGGADCGRQPRIPCGTAGESDKPNTGPSPAAFLSAREESSTMAKPPAQELDLGRCTPKSSPSCNCVYANIL
eukprot:4235305-Amphidinium_carterae.1